uniref:Uncharacterized protein n=1 Tax=Anopheles epiroticus TaxID=199890 RepID=A0A182PIZ2_9DIPT
MANALNSIIWLLLLIFVSFWLSFFCAGWYVLIYPLTLCIPALSHISDILLSGARFIHICCRGILDGRSLF